MREQAVRYGAEIRHGQVNALEPSDQGFRVHLQEQRVFSRFVLLSTGVQDLLPDLQGAEQAVLRSVLRFCPICDAYEATGKRIAVIGSGEHAAREARFLRTYSDRVTMIQVGNGRDRAADDALRDAGVALIESNLEALQIEKNGLALRTPDGLRFFDVVYSALGCRARTQLAADLGASLDENGALRVNAHQQTSVPGLYAAGDIVRGLNQVVVAAAEAAIAATDMHNRLRD
jgi:thioredoxin reductase (NADPH)